ncbi:MAG TPA: hypothetical protein VKT82_18485 [Ktedonobacterales bacterium]|nr:hypothetical protein [Ktedonobacterales bacterium]
MRCPHCDLYISTTSAQICPRCGQPLSNHLDRIQDNEPVSSASKDPKFQPTFSSPTTPRWTPGSWPTPAEPAPRRSRSKRNLISALVFILIIAACAGWTYLAFFSHGNQTAGNPPVPGANVLFADPLNSDTSGWSYDTNHCLFKDNAYHVKNSIVCFAPAGNIGDADISVQAKQVAGPLLAGYGISLRRESRGNRYDFDIDGNSQWAFFQVVNDTATALVDFTPNAAIKGGLNTINTLRVEAKGSHFVFFVNGTQVGEADDTTFASGEAGLGVSGTSTEVAYTNFEIDKVS